MGPIIYVWLHGFLPQSTMGTRPGQVTSCDSGISRYNGALFSGHQWALSFMSGIASCPYISGVACAYILMALLQLGRGKCPLQH